MEAIIKTKTLRIQVGSKKVLLEQREPLNKELRVWEVFDSERKFRYGVIRQVVDPYLEKRIGWQRFKVKYWIGSRFYPQEIMVANSRIRILDKMIPNG